MKHRFWRICVLTSMLMAAAVAGFAQDVKKLPVPDERYKLDVLLVVAHPDDEAAATAYLAKAMDKGKRAGVAYGTRGSSGANEAGTEQAAALGDIREIEARRALAKLGISDVWFIGGCDTASQDVLQITFELGSWRNARADGANRSAHAAGGDSHILAGNLHRRGPRRSSSGGSTGD